MKKTTVRFVGVGAILFLGALALALAQHDARQNSEDELVLAKPSTEQPQPIPVDESPLWGHSFSSSKTIVRANDDSSSQPPSLEYSNPDDKLPPAPLPLVDATDNPLRGQNAQGEDSTAGEFPEASSILLAGGEGPPKQTMPEIPSTMPTIAPQTSPTLLPPPGNGSDIIRAPQPGWAQAPPATGPGRAQVPPAGSPVSRPSASQSMSDTQMPVMPTTNLAAPPTSPGLMQPPGLLAPNSGNPVAPPVNAFPAQPSMPSASTNGSPASSGQLIASPASNSGASYFPNNATNPGPLPGSAGGGVSGGMTAPSARLGAPTVTPSSPANSSGAFGAAGTNAPSNSAPASSALTSESRSPYAGTILGRLISNQPGNSSLLGSQNPVMLIQKRMAGECQVGKKATVIITVRNAGNSPAQDVEVIDSIPAGASFADAMPTVTPTAEGIMVWKLGEMGPNDERTITLQIVPERQGEMGSTAVVRFAAQASVRTLATLPKLELTFQAAPDVLIGGSHSIDVHVRNTGTGVARAVTLEADIPKNLRHETGDTILEALLGDIAPGESKRRRLDTIAAEPGATTVALRALTEDGVQQEQAAELRVLAPALEAVITGPNRRYLDRQATFQITIKNTGTAPASKCEFTMRLPAGLNFNSASSEGGYNAAEHAVMWSVPEWPAGYSESIELTVLPVETGSQQMIFQGAADLGVKCEARGAVTVEEQGELTFTIDQDADPIELSSSTTYTVEVRNVGRPDRNVELSLQLPPGSEVLKVDAPVQARVEGDQLRFDPIPQMDGRTSQKFRVEVRHGKVGTQKVSAQLRSQNRPTLVIKEEATEVYNDRD